MKLFIKAFVAIAMVVVCSNIFYSCKGNDNLCYANMDFIITENEECEPGDYIGFDLLFKDKFGNETLRSYVIPASIQSHVIALPPSASYDVLMRNNGVQNGCGGPIYFDIVITDPDDGTECFRTNVSADERPSPFTEIASFNLGETCENCPDFSTPDY